MEFLFFIPMKQVPQDELKPSSLNEQSSWLLKPAYKYRANFGKCQMRKKNVLTNVIVRLWSVSYTHLTLPTIYSV